MKVGDAIVVRGVKGVVAEIDKSVDGKTFVSMAFEGRVSQWRVPIEEVQVAPL